MAMGSNDGSSQTLANGRYLITAKLGEGGMGAVYRATDRNIDADVVIKVPLRAMLADPEFSRRFKEEIRSLVKLSHPNIVKLSDVGDWDGLPFAVMQFLSGGSLEDRRPTGPAGNFGASDPREIALWLRGIASALDYVHSQNYVHRDVKPGNILFDTQGHPFLGDFGVVKVLASASDVGTKATRTAMTGAGMVVGTAEYMAPELIMGEAFDGRVDQYALAASVYEILCGQRPFEDEVKTKVLVHQTTKPPPLLNVIASWIPSSLSDAVLKGLAKDPKDRYANCSEFAAAVISAVAEAFGNQPERIRFQCTTCRKTLGLSPADYKRLSESGRSVPCPGCKAPFQVPQAKNSGATPPSSGAEWAAGGTRVEPRLNGSGEVASASARRATVVESAGAASQNIGGANLAPRTVVERLDPRPPVGTLVEQPGLVRSPVTMIEQSGPIASQTPTSGLDLAGDAPLSADVGIGSTAARSNVLPIPWIIAGLSAAAACIALVFTVGLLTSKNERINTNASLAKAPAPRNDHPQAPSDVTPLQLNAQARPADSQSLPLSAKTTSVDPRTFPRESAPDLLISEDDNPNKSSTTNLNASRSPLSNQGLTSLNTSSARVEETSVNPPSVPPMPSESTIPTSDSAIIRPTRNLSFERNPVPLEKLLANPFLYANKMVVLKRVYCIANIVTHRPDGTLTLPIIESDLVLQQDAGRASIFARRGKDFELDVDPKLAISLMKRNVLRESYTASQTPPNWGDNVAIFTVAVTPTTKSDSKDWVITIIKGEFLVNIGPDVVVIAKKRRLKVVYKTLTITPDGETRADGKPEDWAQPERILHIANQFKGMIENQARQLSDAKWAEFNNLLNNVINRSLIDTERNDRIQTERNRKMIIP